MKSSYFLRLHKQLACDLFIALFFLSFTNITNAQINVITDTPVVAAPFETYRGTYNYVVTGGTLRTGPNGSAGQCQVANSDAQTLTGIPVGATITRAYLYWAGSGQVADTNVTFQGESVTSSRNYTASYDFNALPNRFYFFNGIADVTSIVAVGRNTTYTFADLTVDVGGGFSDNWYCSTGGVLSGWALLVVYNDPSATNKVVNIYEGFDINRNSTSSFTLANLEVTPGGEGSVAGIIWEGDETLSGTNSSPEEFRFNGFSLVDPLNPANSTYNGTVTSTGSNVEYGVDVDYFNVSPYISGGDTEATLEVQSSNDLIFSSAFVVAVDNLLPELSITKTSFPTGELIPGSLVKYKIEVENTAVLPVSDIVLDDVLPSGVTYVPGSAQKTYPLVNGVQTTASYSNSDVIPEFDNNCNGGLTEIVINVPDSFIVDDLNVGIALNGFDKGDVNLWIESPAGVRLMLLKSRTTFGADLDNFDALLDSESVNVNGTLYDGNHDTSTVGFENIAQSVASLSTYTGINAKGDWKIIICDNFSGSPTNYLQSSLRFTYTPANDVTNAANPPVNMVLASDNVSLRSAEKMTITFDAIVNSNAYGETLLNRATVNSVDLISAVSDTAQNTVIVNPCVNGASTNGVPTVTDKDGDGINNTCDVDDDNDGVLDVNEDICVGVVDRNLLGGGSGNPQSFVATNGVTSVIENLTDNVVFNDVGEGYRLGGNTANVDREYRITFSSPILGVELDFEEINNNIDGEERLKDFLVNGGGFLSVTHTDKTTDLNVVTSFVNGELRASLGGGGMGTRASLKITSTVPFTELKMTFDLVSFNPELGGGANNPSGILLKNICILEDVDNDGLIGSLDTDSDNDNCPDAFEGGGTIIDGLSLLVGGSNGGVSENLGMNSDSEGKPILGGGGFEQVMTTAIIDNNVSVACTADLNLIKKVDNVLPKVGDNVVYTLTVNNKGPLEATGVKVTDVLPVAFLSYVSDDSSLTNTSYSNNVWDIGVLSVGQTVSLQITANVNNSGTIVNVAEITQSNQVDVDSVPNSGN
ncbi:DUF11 domain-containing protein [Tenacibaculum maritimum]|uniref:DUF11 domain-containing protein n=1 Tax=Tenacibaculum maritimum TaxID=107401 RepID=UPI0012E46493|nr:DUF11 domain-containing protein [Tenacibaculum maritimum]CAA0170017.1 hypothetical protein TFA04_140053 [Tenacibaculum maritimum]